MSWQKKPIAPPLLDGVEALATSVSSATQPVISLLDVASGALNAAKSFLVTTANPTTSIAQGLISEVENLTNDIFGTGVYQLVVQPFELNNKIGVPLIGQSGPIDTQTKLFEIEQTGATLSANDFGIPNLTPRLCIDKIVQSFNDLGDLERPQFSSSSSVAAFGFLVSAPDINGFQRLLKNLQNVWGLGAFERLLRDIDQKANLTTGRPVFPSRPPNWDSVRLNSVTFLKAQQDQLNDQISFLKGLVGGTDELLEDFINVVERKINNMTRVVQDFNRLISDIKSATSASGIYLLDIPAGVGGNARLQREIRSEIFDDLEDNISAAVIYVGGGPSLAAVETMRALLS